MVGILLNPSSTIAAQNLELAESQSQEAIARLSSGSRIINPTDDVAGLAVGTILQINVSTMRAALTNAAQATSLLAIADGALDNIGQILQRQKALATEAAAGALSDVDRGFLNEEFQNLSDEINRLATTTNFNGINLIDGGLFNSATIVTDTTTPSTSTSATLTFSGGSGVGSILQIFSSAATTPSGISRAQGGSNTGTFVATPFTVRAAGGFSAYPNNLREFDATGTAAASATNFVNMIANLLNYTGDDPTTLNAKGIASQFEFSVTNTSVTITAKSSGTNWNNADITATTGLAQLNGSALVTGTPITLITNGTSAVNGALPAGGFSASTTGTAGTTAYSNDANAPGLVPSTYAQGEVSDSLLSPLATTQAWATGVNFSGISNNPGFVGKMPDFTGNIVNNNEVNLSVTVGGITYYANSVNTNPSATYSDTVVFYSNNSNYGSFSLNFASGQGMNVVTQSDLTNYIARLNAAFNDISIYQRRTISSYTAAGTVYPTGSAIPSGSLDNSKFWMINNSFANVQIQDVKVTAPISSTSSATISFTINGQIFSSGYQYDGSALALTSLQTANTFQLGDTSTTNLDGRYGFVNQSNPNQMLIMQYGSSTALSITTADQASGLESALKVAFGINNGTSNAGLTFQVGSSSADTIEVQIQGTQTTQIYLDPTTYVYTPLNISTANGAVVAGNILDNAISLVTANRAQVGSLETRFDYAQSSINSSISNQDSARSIFLDADISAESTNLALAQVRLQASVAVLAQANQLPSTLLKLVS